jgi:uncharacterized protein (TIGR03435 family)
MTRTCLQKTMGAPANRRRTGSVEDVMRTRQLLLLSLVAGTSGVALAQPEPSFDVVSIKRNVSGDLNLAINTPSSTAFNTTNLPLLGVIRRAYQVKHVANAPDWIENERYDIAAKAPGKPTTDEVNAMLRTMLKERLRLNGHVERREIPVYALVVVRPNHRGLKPFTGDCAAILAERDAAMRAGQPSVPAGNMPAPCGYTWTSAIQSGGITLSGLAGLIDYVAGRVVVDRTNLPGRYEFTLRFTPAGAPGARAADAAPDLFTALQEQLGLKLEATKAPVDTLVIDHVERPSEN